MSEIAARREAEDAALRGLVTGSYNGQSIPKQRTIDYAAEVESALTRYRAIEDAAVNLRHIEITEGRWTGVFITQAELDAALKSNPTDTNR